MNNSQSYYNHQRASFSTDIVCNNNSTSFPHKISPIQNTPKIQISFPGKKLKRFFSYK